MLIKSIQIKNYKSILDSSEIHLEDRLTVFIGKNESGKSNILRAIRDINDLKDDARLYPYHNNNYKPSLTIKAELFDAEKKILKDQFDTCLNQEFTIEIAAGNNKTLTIEDKGFWDLLDTKFIDKFKTLSNSDFEIKFQDSDMLMIDTFDDESKEIVLKGYKDLLKDRNAILTNIEEVVFSFLPNVKYLSQMENNLPQKIDNSNINSKVVKLFGSFIKKQSGNKISDNIFSEILANTNMQEKKKNCDTISKVLTRFFKENYKQYNLKFDLSPSENEISIYVKDFCNDKVTLEQEDGMCLYLDERSTGLNWFVSFIITCNSFDENEIFVLDEPGMYLHLEGQQDMLKILKTISMERQIIICTHSPYLIDTDMIPIIRLVEKNPAKLDDEHFDETKVYKNLHSYNDHETIQTLCDAIGFNITKGLSYHSEKALIVEGISDLLLIKAFAKIVNKDLDYDIYFAKTSSKMDIMYALLSGLGIKKIVALFDKDSAGLTEYKGMPYIHEYATFTHEIDNDILLGKKKLTTNQQSIEDVISQSDFKKYYLNDIDTYFDVSKTNSEMAKVKNSKYLDSKILLDNIDTMAFDEETKQNINSLLQRIEEKFNLYEN